MQTKRNSRIATLLLITAFVFATGSAQAAQATLPNILVIMGDDIGWFNISAYNHGTMGYQTPNIDRIAREGAMFTDYYGQQSCTAGRAAFITGQTPFRTGLTKADVPLPALLSVGRYDPTQADLNRHDLEQHDCNDPHCNHEHPHHDHPKAFSTWSYETDRPLSLEALQETASKLPAHIYRAKGVIYTADAPERRAVLQVVGRRVDISLADEWRGCPPRTQIVAIGAAGAIDEDALRDRFEQCLSTFDGA